MCPSAFVEGQFWGPRISIAIGELGRCRSESAMKHGDGEANGLGVVGFTVVLQRKSSEPELRMERQSGILDSALLGLTLSDCARGRCAREVFSMSIVCI